ncbi:hypothetical protein ATANTOWER_000104 [Ataeniobius toweri]|uniref:Uncharacterized protein n=1 Tax=Ataeniobius toweri TaxID=208326 RepID=A0ABU7BWT0_9TELE|nr:hypothetical protein [Ataeniobius toweri]
MWRYICENKPTGANSFTRNKTMSSSWKLVTGRKTERRSMLQSPLPSSGEAECAQPRSYRCVQCPLHRMIIMILT